ncbi:MAG: hypothetical protein DMG57_42190 [Acidobacteria bacterium]|nr:MAG: hypothetical protein DMG57_42190 [Acidobacteriota bacterium]
MMALGAACTGAGDAFMWANWHGFIPVVIQPLEWFIWFVPVTAFASAPCYHGFLRIELSQARWRRTSRITRIPGAVRALRALIPKGVQLSGELNLLKSPRAFARDPPSAVGSSNAHDSAGE